MPNRRRGREPLHPGVRVLRRVELDPSGCWLWTGPVNVAGYGILGMSFRNPTVHRTVFAHRAVYHYLRASVPKYMDLHHTCHVRRCVNPWHLEPLTHGAHSSHHNAQRPLADACVTCGGTDWSVRSSGKRLCRACQLRRGREWRGTPEHSRKCRCESCMAARVVLRATSTHGTISGYADGCRCDACSEAKSRYDAARYQKRKAARA